MSIQENLLKVRQRMALACSKVKRSPDSLTLVAVSKERSVDEIKEIMVLGITDIGESRVQEAFLKYEQLKTSNAKLRAKWHLVGHLQTNKVREAVRIFDLIQSVDSLRLAQEIDKQAARINKVQDILVEAKTSPEATKFGLDPLDAAAAVKEISKLKNLRVWGLMTIAPFVDDPEKARAYFRKLRGLMDEMTKLGIWNLTPRLRLGINGERRRSIEFGILSMGMSDDFEVAIEEGANMVRIGRAIFNSSE
ncbi:MAG: YggS family pyridoxal phosphate-dependent enzyme [Candidatus Omnitrophota bacterium]